MSSAPRCGYAQTPITGTDWRPRNEKNRRIAALRFHRRPYHRFRSRWSLCRRTGLVAQRWPLQERSHGRPLRAPELAARSLIGPRDDKRNETDCMNKKAEIPQGTISLSLIDHGFDAINLLIKWGAIVAIAYFTYLAIKELAGHQTVAQFIFGYFSGKEGGGSKAPWIGTTILTSAWGAFERWLRHRKVATMSTRLKDLESFIDAGRTSSGLDASGRPPRTRGTK